MSPVAEQDAEPGRPRRPHLLGELLIVLVLLKVYDYIRSLEAVREAPARVHGRDVYDLERWLHLDAEGPGNRWLTAHHAFEVAASYWYQYAHISFAMAVLAWCYISGPQLYRRARNAVVLTNVVGMTVFLL